MIGPSMLRARHSSRTALPRAAFFTVTLCLSATATHAPAQTVRPDRVSWVNPRGRITTDTGTITKNSLDKVMIDLGRSETVAEI